MITKAGILYFIESKTELIYFLGERIFWGIVYFGGK